MQKTEYIWFDGKMTPWDDAKIHVLTHALHYGTGVFEGIRTYKCADGSSAIFRLQEHSVRLIDSAKIMRFNLQHDAKTIEKGILDTVKINSLAEGYIRPLSFVGYGEIGVNPGTNPIQTIIAVWPWGAYLGADGMERGIRVKTSTFIRHHVNAMMTKSKTSGNYVNSVLAKMEALADGYDEALMLDSNGFVSEATGENIFIIKNKVIKTTPLTSILGGITRNTIMTLANDLGYDLVEQQFSRDELYTADEAFFTGTAAELTPIREVDLRTIGAGKAGPMTKTLQDEYFKIVKGQNSKYESWLTRYTI